jgi:hypothetical protein
MEAIISIFYSTREIKRQDGSNFLKTNFGLVSILNVTYKAE